MHLKGISKYIYLFQNLTNSIKHDLFNMYELVPTKNFYVYVKTEFASEIQQWLSSLIMSGNLKPKKNSLVFKMIHVKCKVVTYVKFFNLYYQVSYLYITPFHVQCSLFQVGKGL